MSINIVLGVNRSEKNKIGKSFTQGPTFTGVLREPTDLLKPSILIEASDLSEYNYARIPAFHRYYFVESMEVVKNDLWRVNFTVDVLESFKTAIKAQKVILADSEENGASDYLSGDQWRAKVKTFTDIKKFPHGLNDSGEYILITVGG